jgi:hypothetical protein
MFIIVTYRSLFSATIAGFDHNRVRAEKTSFLVYDQ